MARKFLPAPPHVPADADDLEVAELPPLDGEGEEGVGPAGDEDDVGPETAEGDLDDSTGENDALHPDDLDVDPGEGRWLEEPADAEDLDIGAIDVETVEASGGDAEGDDGEPRGEDSTLGESFESAGLDSGEEGPDGPDEELRDQDLPALGDAQDDEVDDDPTGADLPMTDEPLGLGWAAHPWARVGAPVPIASAVAVACTARGAFVAGALDARQGGGSVELYRVDLEGGCQAIRAEGVTGSPRALSVEGDLVVIRTDLDEVYVAHKAAAFEPLGEREPAADAVAVGGRVWVRTRSGKLLSSGAGHGLIEPHAVGAKVIALAPDAVTGPVALLADDAGRAVGVLRADAAGHLRRETPRFEDAIAAAGTLSPGILAVAGPRLAFGTARGLVYGSDADGWRAEELDGQVVALAFVDGGEGLVAAVYVEADDTTGLVRLGGCGPARVVALLGPTRADIESDGKALGLACDDARGVVWVAGGFGLAALSTR